jgi:hypothetical protein
MDSAAAIPAEPPKHIRVIPFAVAVPPELLGPRALDVSGVVGTLTLLGDKSVMVWFGLGQVQAKDESNTAETAVVGKGMFSCSMCFIVQF